MATDKDIHCPLTAETLEGAIDIIVFHQTNRGVPLRIIMDHVRTALIANALREHRGNITKAAKTLGLSRSYLTKLINEKSELIALCR